MNKLTKILIILSVTLFSYSLTHSQTVTWQKWYDYNDFEDNGNDVIETFDGGYLVLANTYSPSRSCVVRKLDVYGNVEWLKLYDRQILGGGWLSCYTVTQAKDSGYVISGDNGDSAIIFKIKKLGEIGWIKKFSRPGFFRGLFGDHKATGDGGIIACGRLNDPSVGYVVKTDSAGNLQWDRIYNYSRFLSKVALSKDGSLFMIGFGSDFDKTNNSLIKTDITGNQIWRDSLTFFNPIDLVINSVGNIFVGGGHDSLLLYKFDTSGVKIFQKSYFRTGVETCQSMCLSVDGNILLAANNRDGIMAVSKITPNGDLIFNKIIVSNNNPAYAFLPYSVNATKDYGFIFTGFTNYPPTFQESNTYVSKTDSLCNAPLIVGVANNQVTIAEDFTLYQNYPNPFNPITTINFDLSKRSLVTLRIFDIFGRKISTLINGVKNNGKYQISFDTRNFNLSSGAYIYQLKVLDHTISKKMVLLK